ASGLTARAPEYAASDTARIVATKPTASSEVRISGPERRARSATDQATAAKMSTLSVSRSTRITSAATPKSANWNAFAGQVVPHEATADGSGNGAMNAAGR